MHVNVNSIRTGLFLPPGCRGGGSSEAPPCNYKTTHGMVSNMSQNNVLVISNVQAFLDWHNYVIWRYIVDSISRIQIASAFPSKWKNLNHNVSDKIKKLVDTLVTFNTSSDVMMASFMVKEGSGTIRHLGSTFLNFSNVSTFTLNTSKWR